MPSLRAIPALDSPAAPANTMRARTTWRYSARPFRTNVSNSHRSDSLSMITYGLDGPIDTPTKRKINYEGRDGIGHDEVHGHPPVATTVRLTTLPVVVDLLGDLVALAVGVDVGFHGVARFGGPSACAASTGRRQDQHCAVENSTEPDEKILTSLRLGRAIHGAPF